MVYAVSVRTLHVPEYHKYEHLLKDDSIHVVSNVGIFCLHPEVTLTCAWGTPNLHVEEAVRATTTPDTRKLQHAVSSRNSGSETIANDKLRYEI